MKSEFAKLGILPEEHYKAYGRAEGLQPNAYFNEAEYLAAKLAALKENSATSAEWAGKTVAQLRAAFDGLGLSPAEHYEQYGAFETRADGTLLNPSNAFDANAYFAAKLAQLQKTGFDGADAMTVQDVVNSLKATGMSPVSHFQSYGATESRDVPLIQTVPMAQRMPNDANRATLGELVPGNYNSPSKAPASAVAAPVTKPADVGGLSTTAPTPPAAALPVPGDASYVAPPAQLVDGPGTTVIPPTAKTGTGPNASFVVVDNATNKGTVINIDGKTQGHIDNVAKDTNGNFVQPPPNVSIKNDDNIETNLDPRGDNDQPVAPPTPTPTPDPTPDPPAPIPFSADISTTGDDLNTTHTLNLRNNASAEITVTVDASNHIAVKQGSSDVTIADAAAKSISTIDASTLTGYAAKITSKDNAGLNLAIKGQTGTNTTEVTGGAGVDTFSVDSGNVRVNASTGQDITSVAGGNATLALGTGKGQMMPNNTGVPVKAYVKVSNTEGLTGFYAGNEDFVYAADNNYTGANFTHTASKTGTTTLLGTANADNFMVDFGRGIANLDDTARAAVKAQAAKLKIDGGAGTDMLYVDVSTGMLTQGSTLALNDESALYTYLKENVTNVESLWLETFGTSGNSINIFLDNVRSALKLGADQVLTFNIAEKCMIEGSASTDKIYYRGNEACTINAGGGNDYVQNGSGGDIIYGGTGADWLRGGDGRDTIYASNAPSRDTVVPDIITSNNEWVLSALGGVRMLSNGKQVTWETSDTNVPAEGADFSETTEALWLSKTARDVFDMANVLEGGKGDDALYGASGAKDVFLYQVGGAARFGTKGFNGVTSSDKGESNEKIHGFEIGTDTLMIMDQDAWNTGASEAKILGQRGFSTLWEFKTDNKLIVNGAGGIAGKELKWGFGSDTGLPSGTDLYIKFTAAADGDVAKNTHTITISSTVLAIAPDSPETITINLMGLGANALDSADEIAKLFGASFS